MLYVELESLLVRTPPNPHGPSGFDALLAIAERGAPFTAVGGRAFISVPAPSGGHLTFPIRSRAFRQWVFDQCFSLYDTVPTTHAFSAILHHLEAQAARDPERCNVGVPYRVDCRCLAWLLAALRTHGPYPILILRGPSGCGKSLAARILRTLIDPSASPFTPF